MLKDSDFAMIRAWCNKWKLPPNDERVLNIPLSKIQEWLMCDRIEDYVYQNETSIKDVSYEDVFPKGPDTLSYIFDKLCDEKSKTHTYEEIDKEALETYRKIRKEQDRKWSKE